MNLAFNVLIAEKLLDKSAESAIIKMANEMVIDLLKNFDSHLKELTCSVMYSDDVANLTKVNEEYKNLQLDGSESFVEMYIKIEKHNRKEPIERSYKIVNIGN